MNYRDTPELVNTIAGLLTNKELDSQSDAVDHLFGVIGELGHDIMPGLLEFLRGNRMRIHAAQTVDGNRLIIDLLPDVHKEGTPASQFLRVTFQPV